MNKSLQIFLVSDEATAVKVTYDKDEQAYTFKTWKNLHLEVDDLVVVETSTRHGFTVCKITEVDVDIDFDLPHDFKWIVGKVDIDAFKVIKDQEKSMIDRISSAEKQRRRRQLREDLLADTDIDVKALPLYSEDEPDNTE